MKFLAGSLFGAVLATATVSGAAILKANWDKFDVNFQLGYIAGFLDTLRIARTEHPGGPLDRRFPHLVGAKNIHWFNQMKLVWEREDMQGQPVFEALFVTGQELTKLFESKPWYEHQLDRARAITGVDEPTDKVAAERAAAAAAQLQARKDKRAAIRERSGLSEGERKSRRMHRRLGQRAEELVERADTLEQRAVKLRSRAAKHVPEAAAKRAAKKSSAK